MHAGGEGLWDHVASKYQDVKNSYFLPIANKNIRIKIYITYENIPPPKDIFIAPKRLHII